MLRPASQAFHSADDLSGLRVDRTDALAAAIDGEDALRLAIVKDRVWVIADRHFADYGERLQIEYGYGTGVRRADKAAPQFPDHCDAMDIASGDLPDDRS